MKTLHSSSICSRYERRGGTPKPALAKADEAVGDQGLNLAFAQQELSPLVSRADAGHQDDAYLNAVGSAAGAFEGVLDHSFGEAMCYQFVVSARL